MNDRKSKVEQLIKEAVATFVLHEANTDPLITITRVDMSPDLKRALIFFTAIPDAKEQDALIFLKRTASELRNFLKENARLKRIPHLDFFIDAGEKHRQHVDEVFRTLENKD